MKTYLLPENLNAYKANLHCHTTVSDGGLSPADTKAAYQAKGYSIVAFTDHDVLVDHSDLCDEQFLALNGYEMEVNEKGNARGFGSPRTCHMCLIAKKQDNLTQVCYHKDRYIWGNALAYKPQLRFDGDDYNRVYSHEGINDMIRLGKEAGFFVTYNHPAWSLERYPDYSGYEGMHAMEIFNTGCWRDGYDEYNGHVYDDLLQQGKRIFCVAADDNHHGDLYDCFGGWVNIRCDKLDYDSVIAALEKGHFYASTGPSIFDYTIEDDIVHITTSPAREIHFITAARRCQIATAPDGKTVSEASFRVDRAQDLYFRVDVIDEAGQRANTNAIFVDTL